MSKIRVAIVGLGNCASSLIQGVHYYRDAKDDDFVPGLMHVNVGDYHVSDIEIVAAFDVDSNKVGRDVAEAIWVEPNNTIKILRCSGDRRERPSRTYNGRICQILPRNGGGIVCRSI